MMKPMIFNLTAAMLLLCACAAEEGEGTAAGGAKRVGMEILDASAGETQTAARATYTSITTGSIGVFLNPKNAGEYDVKKNVRYTATVVGGRTVWSSVDPLFFTSYMAHVCAYHPYVAGVSYENCTSMTLVTQDYDAAYDLSYARNIPMNATLGLATGMEGGAGNRVKFTMERAYALLELNLKRGNLKDDCVISRVELEAAGLKSANTLNITTGAYGRGTAAQNNKFILTKEIGLPKNTVTTPVAQRMLMVPSTGLSGMKLRLMLKSTGSPTLSVSIAGITAFDRGKRYILNLTVNSSSVDVASMQVMMGWDDEAMTNSDGTPTLQPQ